MHTPFMTFYGRADAALSCNGGECMIEKNRKKIDAKRFRGLWSCARPVTQIVPNKKRYDRKRYKDTHNKLRGRYDSE